MTFYEAAVEILRNAGRPLHVKKITSLSVEQNLLTHVGRDPEKTMRTRLAQEIAKTSESLVRTVRPNVYVLVDGADLADAKQTVQPRAVDVPEDIETPSQNHAKDSEQHDNDPSTRKDPHGKSAQDNRNNSQKNDRGRRQKNDDNKQKTHNERHNAKQNDNAKPSDNARSSKNNHNRRDNRNHGASVTHQASPAAQKLAQIKDQATSQFDEPAGDLAAHIQHILQEAPEQALPLKDIGEGLDNTAYAALPTLPNQALQGALTRANDRRAESGQPPLFTSTSDGRWTLIQDNHPLAESLDTFRHWQKQHQQILIRRLEHVIAERSNEQLLGIVALVMERLEYKDITLHPPEDEELGTFSATIDHGLSFTRIAARVFAPDRPITRLDVMAFRGNLHQYNAQRGAIITLGGHSLCAREQIDAPGAAPVVLLHDGKLAELMIRTHVGTLNLNVSVPHLDHAFFA